MGGPPDPGSASRLRTPHGASRGGRPREQLIGGLLLATLGLAVAGAGVWAILDAGATLQADPGCGGADYRCTGEQILGLAVLVVGVITLIIGLAAARGGPTPRAVAAAVGLGYGGLSAAMGVQTATVPWSQDWSGLALGLGIAAPFLVSAFLLLRSGGRLPVRETRTCGRCGKGLPPSWNKCGHCGAEFTEFAPVEVEDG
jgi:hypothetical protein